MFRDTTVHFGPIYKNTKLPALKSYVNVEVHSHKDGQQTSAAGYRDNHHTTYTAQARPCERTIHNAYIVYFHKRY